MASHAPAAGATLSAPVGVGQPNFAHDVGLIQRLLNTFRVTGKAPLREDRRYGATTEARIFDFQRIVLKMSAPDGVVGPNGPTFRALRSGAWVAGGSQTAVVDPRVMVEVASLEASVSTAMRIAAPGMKEKTREEWVKALLPGMQAAKINTINRISAFFGQIAVESTGFTHLEESLSYRSADRLVTVFKKRLFPTADDAKPYVRSPEKLANYVYANKNGNTEEGDGWKFRGRGLIQLTGRANYEDFAAYIDKPLDDNFLDYCLTKNGAAASATFYWYKRKINASADLWALKQVTGKVNAAHLEQDKRAALANKIRSALTAQPAPPKAKLLP